MTPQQDSLSGVIICPAYAEGQRLRVNSFTVLTPLLHIQMRRSVKWLDEQGGRRPTLSRPAFGRSLLAIVDVHEHMCELATHTLKFVTENERTPPLLNLSLVLRCESLQPFRI